MTQMRLFLVVVSTITVLIVGPVLFGVYFLAGVILVAEISLLLKSIWDICGDIAKSSIR